MTVLRATLTNRWATPALWAAFSAITILYFFGLAASAVVPFGPPMSICSVVQQVRPYDLLRDDVRLPAHGAVFLASFAALLVYTLSSSRRVRVAMSVLCLVAPLFWGDGGVRGITQWLLAMPAAPFFTITALTGAQDGEFYAEGFLVFTAIGWWMLLWCSLMYRELWIQRREADSTKVSRP